MVWVGFDELNLVREAGLNMKLGTYIRRVKTAQQYRDLPFSDVISDQHLRHELFFQRR